MACRITLFPPVSAVLSRLGRPPSYSLAHAEDNSVSTQTSQANSTENLMALPISISSRIQLSQREKNGKNPGLGQM
jgi:hypothetical protein